MEKRQNREAKKEQNKPNKKTINKRHFHRKCKINIMIDLYKTT